jgi:hypothetical protein
MPTPSSAANAAVVNNAKNASIEVEKRKEREEGRRRKTWVGARPSRWVKSLKDLYVCVCV